MEISIEKSLIEPRKSMLDFFNRVKKTKQIFLVSNMHLTREIIEEMLFECGYSGYKEVLISCEVDRGKESGLFNILIEHANIGADHILHIGDSSFMDDIKPREAGIDTFPIMSMTDMLSNSSYAVLLDHDESILNRMVIGKFMHTAFDDPFSLFESKGRLKVRKLETYVNVFLSPLAFLYTLWILQKAKNENID